MLGQAQEQSLRGVTDLAPLRQRIGWYRSGWYTEGAKQLAQHSGKLYHEVKCCCEFDRPRVGWVTVAYTEQRICNESDYAEEVSPNGFEKSTVRSRTGRVWTPKCSSLGRLCWVSPNCAHGCSAPETRRGLHALQNLPHRQDCGTSATFGGAIRKDIRQSWTLMELHTRLQRRRLELIDGSTDMHLHCVGWLKQQ